MGFVVGLAPMDGLTDEAFRSTQCQISKPDLIFTEFVSAEGISHGGVKLYDHLLYSPAERPIIGQLFGKDPDSFYRATVILCHLGFDGIDINMGCPAKTVTQHGSGAALIDKPELASQIIFAVKKAVTDFYTKKVFLDDLKLNLKTRNIIKRNLKYSLFDDLRLANNDSRITISVKTRLGIDKSVIDTWIPFLVKHNLDFITLHGRTLKQGYSGQADWIEIAKAVKLARPTPIIGNGNIRSRQQGIEYCKKYKTAGCLIGRAALGNPWAFNNKTALSTEKFQAMVLHAKNFKKIFPTRRFEILRKNFLHYASGLPRAKQLRSRIVTLNSTRELLRLEDEFINC